MARISIQFIGTGDAFGSGGRFHTCFHVTTAETRFLLDCGASSLIAMKRFAVDPLRVDCVFITHFHGDHYGGLPFFLLEQRLVSRRTAPLAVIGPPGLQRQLTASMEAAFPGSLAKGWPFSLEVIEYTAAQPVTVGPLTVTAYPVQHSPGSNPHGLRVEYAGKRIAYSGDTDWTDTLIPLADGADLFVCEAYTYEKPVPYHLSYKNLRAHRAALRCSKLLLTHLSADMLEHRRDVEEVCLDDGTQLVF